MRRLRMVALVAAVTFIAVLTLTPGSPLPYLVLATLLEPWVDRGVLAAGLNVLLFMPLGAVIGWLGRPRLLLGAVAISVSVELIQLLLPDRNPLVSDVLTNTLGACLGYLAITVTRTTGRRRRARQDQMQP